MFDLPTNTKAERRDATNFRNFLLDQGFDMSQYSVYFKLVSSQQKVKRMERLITGRLPESGNVQIVCITDRQYENILVFYGDIPQKSNKTDQLCLF